MLFKKLLWAKFKRKNKYKFYILDDEKKMVEYSILNDNAYYKYIVNYNWHFYKCIYYIVEVKGVLYTHTHKKNVEL